MKLIVKIIEITNYIASLDFEHKGLLGTNLSLMYI